MTARPSAPVPASGPAPVPPPGPTPGPAPVPPLTSLPPGVPEVEPGTGGRADAFLDGTPAQVFTRFLRDQESQEMLLAARRVLLAAGIGAEPDGDSGSAPAGSAPGEVAAELGGLLTSARADLHARVAAVLALPSAAPGEAAARARRQRAPIALVDGCWLDTVSQPATQPAPIANLLLADHVVLAGHGDVARSVQRLRRVVLERDGGLPHVAAADFLPATGATELTAWHAVVRVALSRLPATFLPEVVGVHVAHHLLGLDDLLLGTRPPLDDARLLDLLARYAALCATSPTGDDDLRRLAGAVRLVVGLEQEWVGMLGELVAWHADRPPTARAAEVVARHARYAGRQHAGLRVRGRDLVATFADPAFDAAAFLRDLAASPYLRRRPDGSCRFVDALRFGGPMFGIFDEQEAAVLVRWAEQVQAGGPATAGDGAAADGDGAAAGREAGACPAGADAARGWSARVAAARPTVREVVARPRDDRELLHRIVNVERFANVLPVARARAERGFADAEVLFTLGARGRYTDASLFDYSPEALLARVEAIYWDKLVDPYRPLEEVPDREQVVFNQTMFALGSLVDGAWSYRIGNLGRYERRCDGLLLGIYADEMGHGDLRKNHLALIDQVLASMGLHLPHLREEAFVEQELLPEAGYDFAVHQVCMALFPDSFFPEIVGYNLAIEMYGLGELRLHEIQKLRHHGFDTVYEEVHLSIDNLSAGHSRQAVDVILTYLDDVGREQGPEGVARQWRRVWRGYAAFAFFAEHRLLGEQALTEPAPDDGPLGERGGEPGSGSEIAELLL